MRETETIPLSFGIDAESHLVKTGDHCLRTIRAESSEFFRKFLRSDCARRLIEKGGFIPSEIVAAEKEGELVVRHPEIPFVLYPYEWTPAMLRDAALATLETIGALEAEGYTLKDGTPWNTVFHGARPVWVDLTSVTDKAATGSFPARTDFLNYYVRPLQFFAAGLGAYARLGLTQWLGPPASSWIEDALACEAAGAFHSGARQGLKMAARTGVRAVQRKLGARKKPLKPPLPKTAAGMKDFISGLAISPGTGEWSNYYKGQNELPVFDPASPDLARLIQSTPKHQLVYSILERCRPRSVLDIGCNTGLYSFMANQLGAQVVGLDLDEHAVDEMYCAARKTGAKLTAGCADFVTPMRPAEYMHKPRLRSLHARTRAEMVLCLALVHHWVCKRAKLQFADVVQILSGVAKQVLVVEFVPPEDKHIRTWKIPSWYSLDNFVTALRCEFATVELHESFPAPRKLLVCRK